MDGQPSLVDLEPCSGATGDIVLGIGLEHSSDPLLVPEVNHDTAGNRGSPGFRAAFQWVLRVLLGIKPALSRRGGTRL